MNTHERLFGWRSAFDDAFVAWTVSGIVALLALAPLVVVAASASGRLPVEQRSKILTTWRSWLVLAPAIVAPVLLGAAWVMGALALLALLCHREYARVTGLFRERLVSSLVVLTILAFFFAVLDHWYELFAALPALATVLIAGAAILEDRPKGYVQRVALAVFAVALFAGGLGHLAYFANDTDYRSILLWLFVCVELNDVFAFTTGRLFGRSKLCPATSPGKTRAGAIGALLLTTALAAATGSFVFEGTALDTPIHLVTLGALISVAGQLGDLALSSLKRDVGVKDTGALIPGHGGLLDRFDSLFLAAPAVFHYVGYFRPGIGLDQAVNVITGG